MQEAGLIGREVPSERVQEAVRLGVKRLGLAGLCKRTKVAWSVTAGAGFGCRVRAQSLRRLESELIALGLLDGGESSKEGVGASE